MARCTTSPWRFLISSATTTTSLLFILLTCITSTQAARNLKSALQLWRDPQAKCIWDTTHLNQLVVTANIAPGAGQCSEEFKLLEWMNFPPEFEKKVDMRKVNLQVMHGWIAKTVVELVGYEDEVVVEYAMSHLEDDSQPIPDPQKMQINLAGFLTTHTAEFMFSLWTLLIEAQASSDGIPHSLEEEL